VNDFGSSQVGVAVVCNITCCIKIHGDGESSDINATKVVHGHCATIVLLNSKPLEPLLEANLVAKEKRTKKVKEWEVNPSFLRIIG